MIENEIILEIYVKKIENGLKLLNFLGSISSKNLQFLSLNCLILD